jgi:hypothetical protein
VKGNRDAFGVDPSTGFDGVKATLQEVEAWVNAHHRPPAVPRSRCQRCGTRIWHSGMAIGSHRRSKKCRETEAKLRQLTEQARQEARA